MVDASSKNVPIDSILAGPTSILVCKPSKGGKPVKTKTTTKISLYLCDNLSKGGKPARSLLHQSQLPLHLLIPPSKRRCALTTPIQWSLLLDTLFEEDSLGWSKHK